MREFIRTGSNRMTLIALLSLLQVLPTGCFLQPTVTPQLDELSENFTGTVDYAAGETTSFTLQGTQERLGAFTTQGEVDLVPGEQPGSLIGEGVAVFETANGDKLVGVVTWDAGPEDADGQQAGNIRFSWRDSVQFKDGTVVASTGQFEDAEDRPPGLVVIAIIAILIGPLLPSTQKCPIVFGKPCCHCE